MATRELRVSFTGDTKDLDRAFQKVDRGLKNTSKEADRSGRKVHGFATVTSKGFSRVGVAATGMATAGAGAAALLAKSFISGASDINESLTKNQVLFGKYARGVDEFSKKSAGALGVSRAAALEAVGTFGNLFNALDVAPQKSARLSTSLVRLAADMASFNNASPEETLEAIRSGLVGETEPLRRFGVNINDAQLRQQALQMGLVKTTKEVLPANAKALASVALITKQTAAAHGDFARTSGGLANQQRILKARLADSGAELGAKLMPAALGALKGLNSLFDSSSKGGRIIAALGRAFGDAADWMKGAWRTAVAAVGRFIDRNRGDIQSVGKAMRNVGIAIKAVVTDVIIPAVKILAPAFGRALDGTVTVMRGVIRLFSGVLTGNWKKAWDGLKDIVSGSVRAIGSLLKGLDNVLAAGAKAAGKAILRGIVAGLKGLAGALAGAIKGAVKAVPGLIGDAAKGIGKALIPDISNPFGDGVGKALSFPSIGTPGLGGGMLMGADADLAPFASLGASMGLHTSSGLRPGAITSSGNPSYHGTGDAIDEVGSFGSMRRYASTLYRSAGSRLRELISPFPEFGIKDGRPYRYSGAIQAQHSGSNAHVHVAYTGPFGDGIGDMRGLWTKAGGRKSAAAMAAAIAMAESGGRRYPPSPVNSDGSVDRGPWQINSVHGALSTTNPLGNARAAVKISRNGRDWSPWTTFASGAYKKFLSGGGANGGGGANSGGGGSSSGPTLSRGGSVTGGGGNTVAGVGSTTQGGPNEQLYGPGEGGGGYEQRLATAGLHEATARSHDNLRGLLKALRSELHIKQRRLRKIRKTLRRHLRAETRKRLTEEATTLVGDIGELKSTIKEYAADRSVGGATTITQAEQLEAGVDPTAADVTADTGGDAGAGDVAAAPEPDPNIARLADVIAENNANQQTLIRLTQTQGPQLVAALTAVLSGGIGGKAALGFQTPGYAGSGGVRY